MIKKLLFVLVLTFLIAGCAAQPTPTGNNQEQVPVSGIADLSNRLEAAGATVEMAGQIEQPFFQVPGQILQVNGQDVQVFEYNSEEARQADSNQISPDGSTIGTTMVTWVEPPHFWAESNLIVLYVGTNQEVIDTLTEVLGSTIN